MRKTLKGYLIGFISAVILLGGVAQAANTRVVSIVADGKIIYTSPEITKTSRPIDIDINVKGYNDLKIKMGDSTAWQGLYTCLGNAGFYQ